MPPYVALSIAIIAEVAATTAMKATDGFTRIGPSVIVVIGYLITFYLLAQVFQSIPIGIAYAIWCGGGIILVALIAWVVYGQQPDAAGAIGIALILAGVLVLNLLSKTGAH